MFRELVVLSIISSTVRATRSMSGSSPRAPTVSKNDFSAWVRNEGGAMHADIRRAGKPLSWAESEPCSRMSDGGCERHCS